jgi:tRNA threonylcarbamoyladenosine dehydratase
MDRRRAERWRDEYYEGDAENRKEIPPRPKQPESMSSWLSRTASSHQAQLAGVAILSGAVVAGGIFGYQHVRHQHKIEDLKSSIPNISSKHEAEQLTEYGGAVASNKLSTEDEKSAALAARARAGDWDDGVLTALARANWYSC